MSIATQSTGVRTPTGTKSHDAPVVAVRDLYRTFGERHVLEGINLQGFAEKWVCARLLESLEAPASAAVLTAAAG